MAVKKTVRKMALKSDQVEDTKVEDTKVEDTKVEDTKVEDTKVEDTKVEDTKVEDTKVEDTKTCTQINDYVVESNNCEAFKEQDNKKYIFSCTMNNINLQNISLNGVSVGIYDVMEKNIDDAKKSFIAYFKDITKIDKEEDVIQFVVTTFGLSLECKEISGKIVSNKNIFNNK